MEKEKNVQIHVRKPIADEFKERATQGGYTQTAYLKYLLDLDREYKRFRERCV